MAQLSREEFEALWEDAKKGPVVREAAVRPIQLDMSLSGVLERYMTMADGFLADGKISEIDHNALTTAITALKVVLVTINEKELVAQHIADSAKVVQQQVREQINNVMATSRR